MKKIILLSLLLFPAVGAKAQMVGINTDDPQGVFHIDPQKNTSGGANVSDDVIVTPTGNTGIGTLNPTRKLEIVTNGAITPGVKFVDGAQGDKKILTSDANGVASWQVGTRMEHVSRYDLKGHTPPFNANGQYTGYSITLSKGTWVLRYNLTWRIAHKATAPPAGAAHQVSYVVVYLSTSPTISDIITGSYTKEPIVYLSSYASSQVSAIYNVTSDSQTIYLWTHYSGAEMQSITSYDPTSQVNGNVLEAIRW